MASSFYNKSIILKENTAHYRLYPDLSLITDTSTHIDHLKDYILDCFNKLSDLLKDYIWHYAEFNLHPIAPTPNLVAHIEGTTCYEDNVEDEWFIVYLLIKLTQLDPRLIVSIEDSDGQFLLIEAADHLPSWADPENTENRVYIYRGEVHLISPQILNYPNNDETIPIKIEDALRAIRDEKSETLCNEKIQFAIRQRISLFPEQILGQKHRATCFIPAGVATLLNYQPSLIAWAVRAFYHRDDLDIKACRLMKYFPPENRVKRNVTFTKCLYAQAMIQRFHPDPKIGWNIPPRESSLFKQYDLGVKIACGFEILVNRCKSCQTNSEIISAENCSERRWLTMVKSLEEKGYFKDYLKGSRKYKDLLYKAYDFYTSSMKFTEDYLTSEEEVGQRILSLLNTVSVDFERLKREEACLQPEDNDDWINIDQAKLDEILTNQFANGGDLTENLAKTIPEALQTFINHRDSGIDGAEFPDNSNWKPSSTENLAPIKFDEDKFGDALKNILSFRLPSTESSSSSSSAMSDYEIESAPEEEDSFGSDDDDDDISNHHSEITSIQRVTKAKKVKVKKEKKDKAIEFMKEVKQYMEAMDQELASTEVGKSFERKQHNGSVNGVGIGGPPLATCDEDLDDDGDDNDDDDDVMVPPVDSNLTALKNILESFESQKGLPGPGSNILNSMGVHLPRDTSTQES